MPSTSPPSKKIKIEAQDGEEKEILDTEQNEDPDTNCSICLQPMEDRTVIPTCSHEFCFDCLIVWTAQSRRCPLCTQTIGDYVIHDIRSRFDYRKHHLAPLRSSSPQLQLPPQNTATIEARNVARRRRHDRERERQRRETLDERDKLELSIATRRWVYKHDLYAKHVASNSFTKYRPYPSPAQFAASSDLISRTTTFLRRELQVWQGLDVEFLTNLIISLMKAIDIRSESAVKLLAEFLDMDNEPGQRRINAEHLAHEVYSYVRSPYRDLFVYDGVVQYDQASNISPPPGSGRQRIREDTGLQRTQGSRGSRRLRSPSKSPIMTGRSTQPAEGLGRSCVRNEPEASGSQVRHSIYFMASHPSEAVTAEAASMLPKKEDMNTHGHFRAVRDNGTEITLRRSQKGKGKETQKESEDIDENTVIRPPNNQMLVELGSRCPVRDYATGASAPTTPQSNLFEDVDGSRKANERETLDQAQLPRKSKPADLKNLNRMETRPHRPRSLAESVRSHLSLEASPPQLLGPSNNYPLTHTPSNIDRQSLCQRRSLLQRLSNTADQIDEQQPAHGGATFSHQWIDNHGEIALRPEIARQVTSNTSHIINETAINVRDLHTSTSGALQYVTQDSECSKQQRPSSLHDGLQDDVGEAIHIPRPLATPSLESHPFSATLSSIDDVSDDRFAIPKLEISTAAQPQLSFRTHINNLRDKKEAHQGHVGATPAAMTTHGPPIPAPIILRDDQNLTKLRSDLRAKVLSRLREEHNKQASETWNLQNASMEAYEMDRNSPKYVTGADRSPRRSMRDCRDPNDGGSDSSSGYTNMDSVALEARLRTRMRLRTKLSAEKRDVESK